MGNIVSISYYEGSEPHRRVSTAFQQAAGDTESCRVLVSRHQHRVRGVSATPCTPARVHRRRYFRRRVFRLRWNYYGNELQGDFSFDIIKRKYTTFGGLGYTRISVRVSERQVPACEPAPAPRFPVPANRYDWHTRKKYNSLASVRNTENVAARSGSPAAR